MADHQGLERAAMLRLLFKTIWNRGLPCAIASATLFAASNVIIKDSIVRVPAQEVSLIRSVPSLCIGYAVCRLSAPTRSPLGLSENRLLLLVRGACGAAAIGFLYEAVSRAPLSEATVATYVAPMLTALLAWAVLGEPLGALVCVGAVASFAGVALVADPGAFGSWAETVVARGRRGRDGRGADEVRPLEAEANEGAQANEGVPAGEARGAGAGGLAADAAAAAQGAANGVAESAALPGGVSLGARTSLGRRLRAVSATESTVTGALLRLFGQRGPAYHQLALHRVPMLEDLAPAPLASPSPSPGDSTVAEASLSLDDAAAAESSLSLDDAAAAESSLSLDDAAAAESSLSLDDAAVAGADATPASGATPPAASAPSPAVAPVIEAELISANVSLPSLIEVPDAAASISLPTSLDATFSVSLPTALYDGSPAVGDAEASTGNVAAEASPATSMKNPQASPAASEAAPATAAQSPPVAQRSLLGEAVPQAAAEDADRSLPAYGSLSPAYARALTTLTLASPATGVVAARRATRGAPNALASAVDALPTALGAASGDLVLSSRSALQLPPSSQGALGLSSTSGVPANYDQGTRLLGIGFGLLSAATVAVAYLAIRRIGHRESAFTMALWFSICTFVIAVMSLGVGWPLAPVVPSASDFWLLVLAGLAAYGAQLCLGRSLQLLPASLGSALTFLTAVQLAFAGVFLYGEDLSLGTVLGGSATLLGMYLVALGRSSDAGSAPGKAQRLARAHASSAMFRDEDDDAVWSVDEERAPLRAKDTELVGV